MEILRGLTRLWKRKRFALQRSGVGQAFGVAIDELNVVPIHNEAFTFRLDPKDSLELRRQSFEASEVELVKALISPGQTVVDVGANIGYYTLLFSSLVGEHGRVISFEPDPDNFALLQYNLIENGRQNVVLHQRAVGSEHVELQLYRCAGNNGMHRVYQSICCGDAYVTVQSVVLDEMLADEPSIDFLKMDIEGFEYFALQGMSRLLQQHSPTILIEFSPSALAEAGVTTNAFIRFLLEHGYGISRVPDSAQEAPVPLDAADLLTRADLFDAQAAPLLDRQRCQDLQEFGAHLVTAFDQMGRPFEILQNWLCQKERRVPT